MAFGDILAEAIETTANYSIWSVAFLKVISGLSYQDRLIELGQSKLVSKNLSDFLIQTLSGLTVLLVAGIVGAIFAYFRSEKFRSRLSLLGVRLVAAIAWCRKQWRILLTGFLLVLFEVVLYMGSNNILVIWFSLGHFLFFILVLKILGLKGISVDRTLISRTYDVTTLLNKWSTSGEWVPRQEGDSIELVPHEELKRVLVCNEVAEFKNGEITCEVKLAQDALLDIAFRGDVHKTAFYMARFDARPNDLDGILFSSGGTKWGAIEGRELPTHTSPANEWLLMKIQIQNKTVKLFQNEQLVDKIENANVVPGRISIFAEVKNAYVRRITISQ